MLLGLQLSYPRSGKRMTWVRPIRLSPGSLVCSGMTHQQRRPELSHSSFICEILTEVLGTALFLSFLRTAWSDLPSVLRHYPINYYYYFVCIFSKSVSVAYKRRTHLCTKFLFFPQVVFSPLCSIASKWKGPLLPPFSKQAGFLIVV